MNFRGPFQLDKIRFTEVHGGRMRDRGCKLEQQRFRLNTRKSSSP